MKIVLVIPTLKQGGAERVVSELANHFSEKGINVHVVLLAGAPDFYAINSKVSVHRLGFVNKGSVQKIISALQVFVRLRNLLKEHRPDATLSFMYKYNVFTILASRFLNLKIFVSDRSNPNLKLSFWLSAFMKFTYPFASGIVAQTSLAKEVIASFSGNKNIKVIPNPLKNVQLYPEIAREKIILNVGRLTHFKGQSYLIQAFSKLKLKDWKLVILGEGSLRETLENEIISLNLEHQVVMPGAVRNVDEWLARSSVFAFTSISEGFPNALVEAMAAGLPCVSFDCDAGPRDIINNGVSGFLIETGNVSELASKIDTFIQNPKLTASFATKAEAVRDDYNVELIANLYLDFLLNSNGDA